MLITKQNNRITISHKTFITVLVSLRSLFTRYSYIVVQRYIAMITIQCGSPVGADAGDQKRVMTPPDAMKAGVSYLVMGRPITKAEDPIAVLKAVNASLNG